MIKIEYSAYILKKVDVNASRVGALLKVEWPEGTGYADLHPWPEFGDAYLKEQLKVLSEHFKSKQQTPLSKLQTQSLKFSHLDAVSRSEKKSIFSGLEIPNSHYLITREEQITEKNLLNVTKENFTKIKVKVGGEPLIAAISVSELAGNTSQKLRLDINAQWSASEFKSFADKIPKEFKTRIEFVEDPFHSAEEHWAILSETYGMTFARDFEDGNSYGVRILKPAAEDIFEVASGEKSDVKFVVTSYLDHPVGQVCAAFESAKLKLQFGERVLDCGLLSQNVYEPNEFSKDFPARGPKMLGIEGTGFGFDNILKQVRWQRLT